MSDELIFPASHLYTAVSADTDYPMTCNPTSPAQSVASPLSGTTTLFADAEPPLLDSAADKSTKHSDPYGMLSDFPVRLSLVSLVQSTTASIRTTDGFHRRVLCTWTIHI